MSAYLTSVHCYAAMWVNTESVITTLNGAWNVSFDPSFGGPAEIVFDSLTDWTDHHLEGIKYYSGIATYTIEFDLPSGTSENSTNTISIWEM
jgi:hypothetical protein